MVKARGKNQVIDDSRRQSAVRRMIIAAPLLVAGVFSFGFLGMSLDSPNTNPASTGSSPKDSAPLEPLPVIAQPYQPALDEAIEVVTPPIPAVTNPYAPPDIQNNKNKNVGPASKDAGRALQGVDNLQDSVTKDLLQTGRQEINFEDVKL